jgi:ABC-2 type transport system permease protein
MKPVRGSSVLSKIFAVAVARNKEFMRDRGTMAWNFMFPFLIVAGFAFAYSGKPKPQFTIGVLSANEQIDRTQSKIFDWEYIQFIPFQEQSSDLAKHRVERHQLDFLIDLRGAHRYWVNSTSPKGYILEKMLHGLEHENWEKVAVEGAEVRYVDWLLPGILGLNMMFSALFGVGYVIVRYRKNGVLKRLKATPLGSFQFLSAQILSRLSIIGVTTAIIFVGCVWLLKIPMRGSWFDIAVVYGLGAFCLIAIGLLVACRVRSEELASGLLNLITWPMMFFSGIWFSLEGLNPILQKLALIFPLTHLIDAARAIMIDGAGLASQSIHLLTLFTVGFVSLVIGAYLFRWE